MEGLRGELTTLIVAVADETPYIYTADAPITKIICRQSNVQWMQAASSANRDVVINTSVRLSAVGRIVVSDWKIPGAKNYSNMVYPVFHFNLASG